MHLSKLKLIGATEVAKICSLSRSGLLQQEAEGKFPKRVYITDKRFGYPVSEVENWFKSKFALREKWFPNGITDPSGELDSVFAYASDPHAAAAEHATAMDAAIDKLESGAERTVGAEFNITEVPEVTKGSLK